MATAAGSNSMPSRLGRLLGGAVLALLSMGARHATADHFLDLKASDPLGHMNVVYLYGSYKIMKGNSIRLVLVDSEGCICRLEGVSSLNPGIPDPLTATGQAGYDLVCTVEGTHTITGRCLATDETVSIHVRVVHMDLFDDPLVNGIVQVCQNHYYSFYVSDVDGHPVWLYGINNLDPSKSPAYFGYGYVQSWATCTEVGYHTITSKCGDTGQWDFTPVWVWPIDLKPDPLVMGHYQVKKGQEILITVWGQDMNTCCIFGLVSLNPAYDGLVPTGYGAVSFWATCTEPGDHVIQGWDMATGYYDETVFRVSEVTETKWEEINSDLEPDTHNPGGGLRIFPGWKLSDHPAGPSVARSRVQARATVNPPANDPNQPFEVQFHYFDVDDPSASEAPLDEEANPSDNRATDPAVKGRWQLPYPYDPDLRYAPVTADGRAAAVFIVSPNPGDNWRINAQISRLPMYFCQVPQMTGDGRIEIAGGAAVPAAEVTPLLTTWRRFHVERDTLGEYNPLQNTVFGRVDSAYYDYYNDETYLYLEWTLEDSNDYGDSVLLDDRFVPGILFDPFTNDCFEVLWNSPQDEGYFDVLVSGVVDSSVYYVDLYDDDFDPMSCPPTDRGLLPDEDPDVSFAEAIFRDAYIEIDDEDLVWNSEVDVPPWEHPYRTKVIQHKDRGNQWKGKDWYWIGYILNAFQYARETSGDPNLPDVTFGWYDDVTVPPIDPGSGWGGTAVCLESIRDYEIVEGIFPGRLEFVTVAHELCHSVNTEQPAHLAFGLQVREKISNTQFVVLIEPTKPGWNVEMGSLVTFEDHTQAWPDYYLGKAELAGYVPYGDMWKVTLFVPGFVPREGAPKDYFEEGDRAYFWSRSIMGHVEVRSLEIPGFCPATLDELRDNVASPLP